MDMGSSGSTSGGAVMFMKSYLHFTSGDTLWLREWTPKSPGAVVGACLGLFFVAFVDRLLLATKSIMEVSWKRK